MVSADLWADPAFDNADLLVDLVDLDPRTGLSVLANPNLSSHHLDQILGKALWNANAVLSVGAVEIMAPWDADDQARIIRAAAKKSQAAAERLLYVARLGTLLRLWRVAENGTFAGATWLRRALPTAMSHPTWSWFAEDPDYLPVCEALWDHYQGTAPHFITTGSIVGKYAIGAVTDEHHERLVEMMRQVTEPTAEVNTLLATTLDAPERVLWWAERCELGAVLAAADPRVDAATREKLREPVSARLADLFGQYQDRYQSAASARAYLAPGSEPRSDPDDPTKDELVEFFRGLLDIDDLAEFRRAALPLMLQVETYIDQKQRQRRMAVPAGQDYRWLLHHDHLASGLVALDIVTTHGRGHDSFREAFSTLRNTTLKPAVVRQLNGLPVSRAPLPTAYMRLPVDEEWETRYLEGVEDTAAWVLWDSHYGPLHTRNHYPASRYVAGHLTTARQLLAFRNKVVGLPSDALVTLADLVEGVLAEAPASTDSAPAEDAFSAVLGDALGSL